MSRGATRPHYAGLEDLGSAQLERFRRHLGLNGFGERAQLRLLNGHVVVVGAGGLGAPVLSYLAAAGVGTITVIDPDVVDRSNLHRQVIHGESTVGLPKVDSAAQTMWELHPEVQVIRIREHLDSENAVDLLEGADVVVDGSDNFPTRYAVADAAEILRVPVVHGSILRFEGQVSVFAPGRGPLYRDLFPRMPAAGEVPSCAAAGVVGVLPGVIGTLMATETVKLLAGVGRPLIGRLLFYDALEATFREVGFAPDPSREPVTRMGEPAEYGLACAAGEEAPEEEVPPVPAFGEITVAEVRRRMAAGRVGAVVDVREAWEHRLGALDGARNVPLSRIREEPTQAVGSLPEPAGDAPVILYCQAGIRSAQAREILARVHPETTFLSMVGGYEAWAAE